MSTGRGFGRGRGIRSVDEDFRTDLPLAEEEEVDVSPESLAAGGAVGGVPADVRPPSSHGTESSSSSSYSVRPTSIALDPTSQKRKDRGWRLVSSSNPITKEYWCADDIFGRNDGLFFERYSSKFRELPTTATAPTPPSAPQPLIKSNLVPETPSSPMTPTTPGSPFPFRLPSGSSSRPRTPTLQKSFGEGTRRMQARKEELIEYKHSITEIKKGLLAALQLTNGLAFLTGGTGTGKTLKGPMAMIRARKPDDKGMIMVIQPKRVTATAAYAAFVTKLEYVGMKVTQAGYRLGGGTRQTHSDNAVQYVTAGYMYARLLHNPHQIYDFSVLMFDEAHERGEDQDMLIGILRFLYKRHLNRTKDSKKFPQLIFVSATMNTREMYRHFRPDDKEEVNIEKCVFCIPSPMNSKWKNDVWYIDELEEKGFNFTTAISEFQNKKTGAKPEFRPSLITGMIEVLNMLSTQEFYNLGVVLVFLPGTYEITRVQKELEKHPQFVVHPFHSGIPMNDLKALTAASNMKRVLYPRPVIVATNLAESSITFDSCSVVVDFCLCKVPGYDYDTETKMLDLIWCDEARMTQRQGRTGRVGHGITIRLITKCLLPIIPPVKPDLERMPPDNIIMNTIVLKQKPIAVNVHNFMKKFLTKHILSKLGESKLQRAISNLLTAGVLYVPPCQDATSWDNLKATKFGDYVTHFVGMERAARLIRFGSLFRMFQQAAFLASNITDDAISVFNPQTLSLRVLQSKFRWRPNVTSDDYLESNVMRAWEMSTVPDIPGANRNRSAMRKVPLTPISNRVTHNAPRWHYNCINLSSILAKNDVIRSLFRTATERQTDIGGGFMYAAADTVEDKQIVKDQENLLNFVMMAVTSDFSRWFMTALDKEKWKPDINDDLPLCSTLIVEPDAPLKMDMRIYGACFQEEFGKPSLGYPSVRNDPQNGRILLTFSPPEHPCHCGRIAIGVLEALQRIALQPDVNLGFDYRLDGGSNPHPYVPQHSVQDENWESVEVTSPYQPISYEVPRASIFKEEEVKKVEEDEKRKENLMAFNLTNFGTPYCFGVRERTFAKVQNWKEQKKMNDLVAATCLENGSMTRISPEKAVVGAKCLWLRPFPDPSKKEQAKRQDWSHFYERGSLQSSLDMDRYRNIDDKDEQDHYAVLLECWDSARLQWIPVKDLLHYDSTIHCPEIPLFTKFKPMGWRVMLNSVKPNPNRSEGFTADDCGLMSGILHNKTTFKASLNIDVIQMDERRRLILANDVFPYYPETTEEGASDGATKEESAPNAATKEEDAVVSKPAPRSFVQEILSKKLAVAAVRVQREAEAVLESMRPIKLLDFSNQTPNWNFRPKPTTPPELPTNKPPKELKKGVVDSNLALFAINKVYNPMQIQLQPVALGMKDVIIKIGMDSVNVGFCDVNIADIVEECEYLQRLVLASSVHQTRVTGGKRQLVLDGCSICPAIPGLVALIALIFFPSVEILVGSREPAFAVRIFKKTLDNNQAKLEATVPIQILFAKGDHAAIRHLRKKLNLYVMQGLDERGINKNYFRHDLLEFLEMKRFLRPGNLETLPVTDNLVDTMTCNNTLFMEENVYEIIAETGTIRNAW